MAWSIFTQGGGDQVAVGWAKQLLNMLGAPDTPGNEQFIYQWEKAEGGGGKYNPLNQGPVAGKSYLTTTGEQYGGGAADFASWAAGLQGSYDYLHYSNYKGVLAGLMSNNPAAARSALWASPWAASHYGYGSNWPNVALPNGTAVLPSISASEAPATSGNTDTGATATLTASESAMCAWTLNIPKLGVGPVSVGGPTCLASKTQVRALVGGIFLVGAIGVGVIGVVILVAYSLKGPAKEAAQLPVVKQAVKANK